MDAQQLLVVGEGPVAEALVPMADLLDWRTTVVATLDEATAAMSDAQAVVVTSHDSDVMHRPWPRRSLRVRRTSGRWGREDGRRSAGSGCSPTA